jgi:hypothetical protein
LQTLPPIKEDSSNLLSDSVAKTLEAGPGTWIIQHLSEKHKRRSIIKNTHHACTDEGERDPVSKRQRVNLEPQSSPDSSLAHHGPLMLPIIFPISNPAPTPLSIPLVPPPIVGSMWPNYSSPVEMFNISHVGGFPINPTAVQASGRDPRAGQ